MIDHDDAEKSKVLPLFRQQEEREEGRRRVHRNRGGHHNFLWWLFHLAQYDQG